jgi:hypothetical protein
MLVGGESFFPVTNMGVFAIFRIVLRLVNEWIFQLGAQNRRGS